MLIHGSCVSRDTFEFLPASYRLVNYVARQSAISVGNSAPGISDRLPRLSSPFQDRMIRGDIRGDLLERIRALAEEVDLVLVDLVDERGGVVAIGDGYATRLAEFWSNGGKELAKGAEHIAFGTQRHFSLWAGAFDRIVSELESLGLLAKVLVLSTPWAEKLEDGSPLGVPEWMTAPKVANEEYARYFDHLESRGLRLLRLPDRLALSSTEHRWGPSPFHYTDAAYEWLAQGISRA
ncbi:hypothetical protein Intca_1143 [Intrasporangium calvum DSM 43043]|uniref:SGNH hydrolase-type esterase domain-containing protein n=1 Tax=Intrasporangium calvum (strain ATCC 23552 / DSM 43043 / JCM 3097 / NBRC 12989 / NCIMB 10167 / NRRL B-3866 / 7 KIP) TaxID=710696 RepID=E6SEQ5_INTC7|nr:hypothetical protein Intca_1143 [Intrasporangium calvum DSM 43043]